MIEGWKLDQPNYFNWYAGKEAKWVQVELLISELAGWRAYFDSDQHSIYPCPSLRDVENALKLLWQATQDVRTHVA
jgi:hypothetical protein